MDYAYKVIFAVGVLYTLVSFVISGISGLFHFGSHIGHMHGHIGGDGHFGGHSGGDTGDISGHDAHAGTHHGGGPAETLFTWFSIFINPLVAVSFLTLFGGIGILGTNYFKWNALMVLLIALASGIITATILYKYVAVPLYNSENTSDVSRNDLIGTAAEVVSAILEDGFGEIKYIVNSIMFTAPARHIEGNAVIQGKRVVILNIENNVFYVKEIEEI